MFGAEKGAPRLLDLHDKYDIPATWFIPGHTIDSFPGISGEVHDRGYHIQHHGWSHIPVRRPTRRKRTRRHVERAAGSIVDLTGEEPTGYRSPAWDYSANTLETLDEVGIVWDSSKMTSDFEPHWVYGDWSVPEDERRKST